MRATPSFHRPLLGAPGSPRAEVFRGSQERQGGALGDHLGLPGCSKRLLRRPPQAPKRIQEVPRRLPRPPKRCARGPKDLPRGPQEAPKTDIDAMSKPSHLPQTHAGIWRTMIVHYMSFCTWRQGGRQSARHYFYAGVEVTPATWACHLKYKGSLE